MIRLGIAGIGLIAEDYIRIISNGYVKDVKITALSSRNIDNMNRVVEKYNLKETVLFNNYEEMLISNKIDAVIICTPHYEHPKMAIKAIESNVHTLIEKPIGVYTEEVEKLIEVSKDKINIKAGVLYNRRLCSTYLKLKSMVDKDAIGDLKRVNWIITNLYRTDSYYKSSPWRGTYKSEGGGLIMTQASHQLDLLQWICKMPKKIYSKCYIGVERDIEVENDVSILMEYENGATGQFIASAREFPGSNRLELIGDKGQIVVENDNKIIYKKLSISEKEYRKNTNELFGKIPYTTEVYRFEDDDNSIQHAALISNFIKSIKGEENIVCPIEDGMKSLVLINGAYLSSWLNKTIDIPFDYKVFSEEIKKRF